MTEIVDAPPLVAGKPVPVTIWYDSLCPICSREIAIMRGLDWRRRTAFVDLHAAGADCPLEPAVLLARFHARDGDGRVVSGAAAFALMWRQIPLLWPLGQMARIPAVLILLEHAYGRFLLWRMKR
jgi:predicted DCC family thiol-disulfide oxidoreductase YuxK